MSRFEVPREGALDLEAWMRKALSEGREDEVVKLMKTMSKDRRDKYREVWKRLKGETG